jgi:hypothetical protein
MIRGLSGTNNVERPESRGRDDRMLSHVLGVLVAFVTVLLLLSMIVTGLVQATQAVLRLRSRNLQQGVAALLEKYSGGGLSSNAYRGHAARVLNAPNLAILEKVDRGDSKLRRFLGPKISWAEPAELAAAVATVAGSLSNAPALKPHEAIVQDVERMEPALKKRFQLFIRLWTIFWSLVIAAVFQVSTPELLSSFANGTRATEPFLDGSDKALSSDDNAPTGQAAEKQLDAFGIKFWGRHNEYYVDPEKGLQWAALIGVLMTGILMSFGAPFWFDKLKFLASLRDAKDPKKDDGK